MRTWSLLSVLILAFGVTACSDDDSSNCVDEDGDGYGVGSDCMGADCDDADPLVWEAMTLYADADGDGVYDSTSISMCTDGNVPTGYSETAGTDCDDTDDTVAEGLMLYPDADGDGEYAAVGMMMCTDGTAPTGYSETAGTDCDDNNDTVWQLLTGYVDSDDDGYGDATEMEVCSGADLPAGYADNGTDCDDLDDAIWETVTGYADADGDTVYASELSEACTDGSLPQDWQATAGTDCDDADVFSQVAGTDPGCTFLGTCVDTEMGAGYPDMRGIAACNSVDCNGQDPTCWDAQGTDTTTTCTTDADCNSNNDEYCAMAPGTTNLTCRQPLNCCNYDNSADGLHCAEIVDCLGECGVTYPDPADGALYAQCLQFTCFEGATPYAQFLYHAAQECAATAGCFAIDDDAEKQLCVEQNCTVEFGTCVYGDPAP